MWKSVSVNVTVRCKVDKAVAVYSVCVVRLTQTHLLIDGRLIQDGGEGLCKVSCRVSVSHLRGLLRVKAKVWVGAHALVDRLCRVSCVQRGRILSTFLFYFLDALRKIESCARFSTNLFLLIDVRWEVEALSLANLQIVFTNNSAISLRNDHKKQNSHAVKFHL